MAARLCSISGRLSKVDTLLKQISQKETEIRRKQILHGLYKQKWKQWQQFSSLPLDVRTRLDQTLGSDTLTFKTSQIVKSKQATKVLFELEDKQKVEAVHMNFKNGHHSLCISSQVGCALRCNFCATGAVGFKRQMSADEVTDQVLYFQQNDMPVDSISFMGMGEPLMNPRLFDALELLTHKDLFGFPQRKLSISTVGIIPGIQRLTQDFPQVNLAFSLHSPFAEQRDVLVPQNKTYPLSDVMRVLEDHLARTRRKIFIAYLVLDGYNDTKEHAKGIARLLQSGRRRDLRYLFHVNLLRYNPAFGIGNQYRKTDEDNLARFRADLEELGIAVTTRQSFGVDIDAACGQLFAKYPLKTPKKKVEQSQ